MSWSQLMSISFTAFLPGYRHLHKNVNAMYDKLYILVFCSAWNSSQWCNRQAYNLVGQIVHLYVFKCHSKINSRRPSSRPLKIKHNCTFMSRRCQARASEIECTGCQSRPSQSSRIKLPASGKISAMPTTTCETFVLLFLWRTTSWYSGYRMHVVRLFVTFKNMCYVYRSCGLLKLVEL